MDSVLYQAFQDELEKMAASGHRLTVPKARKGRRPMSVDTLLKKDKAGTLHKKADAEYKLHGHTTFQGIPIAIENRKGSTREGVDPDGKPWKTVFKNPYGYIKKTEGKDGEEIDVYLGPQPDAPNVFVVHQRKIDGTGHDEDKAHLGFPSEAAVRKAYLSHYNKVGPKLLGPITTMTVEELKKRLAEKKKHTKLAATETGGDFSLGVSDPVVGGVPGRKTDKLPTAEGTKSAQVDLDNTTLYTERAEPKPRKPNQVPDRDTISAQNKLAWDGVGSGGSLGSGNQPSLLSENKPDHAKRGDVPSRDGNDVGAVKPKHEAGPDFVTTIPAGGAQFSSQTGAMSR